MVFNNELDFSVLKKYGFKQQECMGERFWTIEYKKGRGYYEYITIAEEDRKVQINAIKLTSVLYDLLKDRVVVKE